jgi:hypothetical protein
MKSWLIPRAIVTMYLCAIAQVFEGLLSTGSGQALSALRQQKGSVWIERRPFVTFGRILSQHRCQIWSGRHQSCLVAMPLAAVATMPHR